MQISKRWSCMKNTALTKTCDGFTVRCSCCTNTSLLTFCPFPWFWHFSSYMHLLRIQSHWKTLRYFRWDWGRLGEYRISGTQFIFLSHLVTNFWKAFYCLFCIPKVYVRLDFVVVCKVITKHITEHYGLCDITNAWSFPYIYLTSNIKILSFIFHYKKPSVMNFIFKHFKVV